MFKKIINIIAVLSMFLIIGCEEHKPTRDIIGNNAFLYYKDYPQAEKFYTDILGFKNVFEIEGFATIFQTSPTSFITIVNDDGSGRAMHSADEPKTVAIALITDQVPQWYDYALSKNLNIRAPLQLLGERTYQSFFVTDPGGYILEFEYLAKHPQNEKLLPLLDASEHIYPEPGLKTSRPSNLGIKASIYWLYHKDRARTAYFYQNVMGLDLLVVQSFADIYTSSRTGYIGLVTSGMGSSIFATDEKAVNVGFITSNAQSWFDFLKDEPSFILRDDQLSHESDENGAPLLDIVIGYDPENYYIEIDQFLNVEANKAILKALKQN